MIEITANIQAAGTPCRDRISWVRHGQRVVFALADGEDKPIGGDFAAEYVIKGALKYAGKVHRPLPPEEWLEIFANLDEQLEREPTGETRLVVVDTDGQALTGACVGDVMGALITDGAFVDFTKERVKQPLLGSGRATPRGFEAIFGDATLLMASDGLIKYTSEPLMREAARGFDAQAVANLVHLPGGRLMDDTAVLLARMGKPQKKHPQDGIIQHVTPTQ